MTKKLAIFVEGQTEQFLIEELIKRAAGTKNVLINKTKLFGGKKHGSPRILQIEAALEDVQYYVLIIDSTHDQRVKSDILEQYNGLVKAGYQKIIGVRDARDEHEIKISEVEKLRRGLVNGLPNGSVPILFVISIMEIEAWFMAEYFHFPQIHSGITVERIKEKFEIDVINDDLSTRKHPSADLSNIYWLENIPYEKRGKIVSNIVSKLDLVFFKNTVGAKFSDLKTLHTELDLFFL